MTSVTLAALVGYIGILSELGGALVLVALFALLRRYASRRPFFPVWGWGWVTLTMAIAALAIRYYGLAVTARWTDDFSPLIRTLYAVYQVDKLMFYGFTVVGVLMYTRGVRAARVLPRMILVLGAYG